MTVTLTKQAKVTKAMMLMKQAEVKKKKKVRKQPLIFKTDFRKNDGKRGGTQ